MYERRQSVYASVPWATPGLKYPPASSANEHSNHPTVQSGRLPPGRGLNSVRISGKSKQFNG